MQSHIILLNYNFTSTTASISSNLQIVNQYEVNNVEGNGGGIVNYSNVRAFLNDDVNEDIINDFFSYLTGSTTREEFVEIYNSDQKLANVFNNYYNSSVLNNTFPSTAVINSSLTGTSGVTIINNSTFNYDGIAPQKYLEGIPLSINDSTKNYSTSQSLTTYTTEESYYIPVFIKRNNSQLDREKIIFDEIQRVLTSDETDDELPDGGLGIGYDGTDYSNYTDYTDYTYY